MAKRRAKRARMSNGKRTALAMLIIVAIGVFVFCGIQLVGILVEYGEADALYSAVRGEYMTGTLDSGPLTDDIDAVGPDGETGATDTANAGTSYTLPDFSLLRAVNSECIGWLRVYDTNIDYPVAKATNNDYYLTHTIKRTENSAGTLFMDFRNASDLSDENTIIYGHNMKSGAMFHDLLNYKSATFFNAHKYIKLFIYRNNQLEELNLRVFSAYRTTADAGYIQRNFDSTQEYATFLDWITGESTVSSGVKVSTDQHIVTLSTCDRSTDEGRFVVHAVIV